MEWLVGYPYKNVAVFDYFNVLTGTDNHHRWYNNAVQHVTSGSNNFATYLLIQETQPSKHNPDSKKLQQSLLIYSIIFTSNWRSDPASISASEKVNIRQMTVSPAGSPQTGSPVTVSVSASSSDGSPVYYKFYYCANYGSESYDTTPWTVVQDYSTTSSARYTFPSAGNYIIMARAVLNPNNEPAAIPIIGQAVYVADNSQVCITGLPSSASSTPKVGETVTYTTATSDPTGGSVYYRFYYRPDYGSSSYDTAPWTMVRDYSTISTCEYTHSQTQGIILVARAVKDPEMNRQTFPSRDQP